MLIFFFIRAKLGLVTSSRITEITMQFFAELDWPIPIPWTRRRRRHVT